MPSTWTTRHKDSILARAGGIFTAVTAFRDDPIYKRCIRAANYLDDRLESPRPVRRKPGVPPLVVRVLDRGATFRALVEGSEWLFADAMTPSEAVGTLMIRYADRFGVLVEVEGTRRN